MGDKSCRTCMVFKQGDCLGRKICEFYRPIPSSEGIEYWPKTMRSRSSYAGSNNYQYDRGKNFAPTKKNGTKKRYDPIKHVQVDWKKKEYDKVLGIKRKRIDCPRSASVLLRYLYDEVVAWISYEEVQIDFRIEYAPNCMLQLNNHILQIDHVVTERNPTRAMFRGVLDVTAHITKPCMIIFVVDRVMFDGVKVNTPVKNDDLLCKALTVIIDKRCHLTELVVNGGTELIYNQIQKPVTDI